MPQDSPTPLAEVIGQRVKTIRSRKLGMTQVALSATLKAQGLDLGQSALSRVESGAQEPTVSELLGIAAALGVSPLALITPEDPDQIVEVVNGRYPVPQLRDWLRGFVPPAWVDTTEKRKAYYDALPLDEYNALRVRAVERLVIWVTDRLLRALGDRDEHDEVRDKDHALQLLDEIKRFADTIGNEITLTTHMDGDDKED
jgi:transcriptional regulator with XRE-family HTH domain